MPIDTIDPLKQLSVIADQQEFSFLWDQSPGLSIAAAGRCQNLELIGQRRFELAQRFSDETLGRIVDISVSAPKQAKPRILFAFTFFEQISDEKRFVKTTPAVQAVLPRWQLSRQAGVSWLRFNSVVAHEADVRRFVEECWLMRENVNKPLLTELSSKTNIGFAKSPSQEWQNSYRLTLEKGIELVNTGELQKLVLAVRQSFLLSEPLDPLGMLESLRRYQRGSCRFLWKRSEDESFFGASPERLLSINKENLQTDALAGTAGADENGLDLLKSEKNLREHELVVSSIQNQLINKGLDPSRIRSPRLARHGHLIHLHTPIKSSCKGFSPLQLVEILHPTPAVAGLPRNKSIQWLRTLEPFDREGYAAPIGWVDSSGDAEFRVAIRCAYTRGNNLHLMAGAGLVKGSTIEGELQEVGLKFAVLANQLDLNFESQEKFARRRSIT
ncbi:Isochorismate synthase Menaquinone-specific isochorismate synthase [Prochlorococcus marinus str. SS2]|nr:Isochorismate synthase Menaquinone-specific isochorismate synthase [Prochlorococcus marinus str. SS2]KGG22836.1 Isochorismate synthase Menaquinone-specific isochorismate synthase [Prochlorococcus marinus str. SS35]